MRTVGELRAAINALPDNARIALAYRTDMEGLIVSLESIDATASGLSILVDAYATCEYCGERESECVCGEEDDDTD